MKKIVCGLVLLTLLFIFGSTYVHVYVVESSPTGTMVNVDPPHVVWGQDNQTLPITKLTITINVTNVEKLWSWQVKLYFDPMIIDLRVGTADVGYPSDSSFVFGGVLKDKFVPIPPFIGTEGGRKYVMMTASLYGGYHFTGSGKLFVMNFTAVNHGSSTIEFSRPFNEEGDTYLAQESDDWASPLLYIPFNVTDGTVVVRGQTAVKQPSNITINATSSNIYVGQSTTIQGQITPQRPNVPVTIYLRALGGRFIGIFNTTTNSESIYRYVWTPIVKAICELRASWDGDEDYCGSQSGIITINVDSMTVYIRADGNVDPPSAPVQRNGDVYTLTGSFGSDSDGIVIERDNTTLDGAGYTVNGVRMCYGKGAYLSNRNNVTIKNLTIENCDHGIYLESSSHNTIFCSTIANCNVCINVQNSSSNNIVFGNNITTCGLCGCGILLNCSSYNKIYHNNFIDNFVQAYTHESSNFWDDGYPSGGNYWSDYTGVDLRNGPLQEIIGSDGIGDTAFNNDHYPFMNPLNIFDAGMWNEIAYHVVIISNSTISNFHFSPDTWRVMFNVTGAVGTSGFCRVVIPRSLLRVDDGCIVFVGTCSADYTLMLDENFAYLHFAYEHSTETVTIQGTWAIPEFSSVTVLLLTMYLMTLVLMIEKKKRQRNLS